MKNCLFWPTNFEIPLKFRNMQKNRNSYGFLRYRNILANVFQASAKTLLEILTSPASMHMFTRTDSNIHAFCIETEREHEWCAIVLSFISLQCTTFLLNFNSNLCLKWNEPTKFGNLIREIALIKWKPFIARTHMHLGSNCIESHWNWNV